MKNNTSKEIILLTTGEVTKDMRNNLNSKKAPFDYSANPKSITKESCDYAKLPDKWSI